MASPTPTWLADDLQERESPQWIWSSLLNLGVDLVIHKERVDQQQRLDVA
jgi:hypothetical protein